MTKTKAIDLADIDTSAACDKGIEIEIVHPVTKEPLGVFINVVGKDGSTFREHVRRKANERIRKQALNDRRGKSETPTVEQFEDDAIELLAICTTGWRNVVYQGAELPFSIDNAKKLYAGVKPIRDQVDEAVGDIENFMKG